MRWLPSSSGLAQAVATAPQPGPIQRDLNWLKSYITGPLAISIAVSALGEVRWLHEAWCARVRDHCFS